MTYRKCTSRLAASQAYHASLLHTSWCQPEFVSKEGVGALHRRKDKRQREILQ